ncbi:MAG: OmpA family protein [Burkholderiales bacterium]|nr:OmpA family protein [Burkholderiales bacterium]
MRCNLFLLPLVLAIGSCSSPPQPPTVDESRRRPANVAGAVDLQACQGQLQNTRIAASESSRAAETAKITAKRLAAQQQAVATQSLRAEDRRNTVYSILFAFGDTNVMLPQSEAARLVEEARASALVVLRGRTDGSTESPAESRIARGRADAVRAYLVQAGVDPGRIRATWQPIGDIAADNASDSGRRLNRRVEVELYRVAPRIASLVPTPDV